MIRNYLNMKPVIADSAYIEDSAQIIGDVHVGDECSVWFNAVIRGDVNYIRIGQKTNVQDGAVLHVTLNKYPLIIGEGVTIGHGAILHGCTVEDYVLIGMGAKILDNARVEKHSLIAAGAVVREGFVVPEGHLVAGVPARLIRPLSDEEIRKIYTSADNYIRYSNNYRRTISQESECHTQM